MKISLFSQSIFTLPLMEAIETTAQIGSPAIELACSKPHFDLETALENPVKVAERIKKAGIKTSALSLFNSFTNQACLNDEIEEAEVYVRLAPLFDTKVIKMTPGPPASADATEEHWHFLAIALEKLVPVAEEVGVRLAFETHMRQLTDTLAGAKRLLDTANSDVVGLTVDFLNLRFAGEEMSEVISTLRSRMYNTHLKNGIVDKDGNWHFDALDTGWLSYLEVLSQLRDSNYSEYLTIECLGPDANQKPFETAKRDLEILKGYLNILTKSKDSNLGMLNQKKNDTKKSVISSTFLH